MKKNGNKVPLTFQVNVAGDSHSLLLTNLQVSRLGKAFVNNFSAETKLSKSQQHKQDNQEDFQVDFQGHN